MKNHLRRFTAGVLLAAGVTYASGALACSS